MFGAVNSDPSFPMISLILLYSYIPVNLKIIPFSMKKPTDVKNCFFLGVQIITVHKAMPDNLPDYREEHRAAHLQSRTFHQDIIRDFVLILMMVFHHADQSNK